MGLGMEDGKRLKWERGNKSEGGEEMAGRKGREKARKGREGRELLTAAGMEDRKPSSCSCKSGRRIRISSN
jgi:hypothetical protein